MAVYSATHISMAAAASARLSAQGHILDNSQLSALVLDMEAAVNSNSGTALADVAADLGITSDPPVEGQ